MHVSGSTYGRKNVELCNVRNRFSRIEISFSDLFCGVTAIRLVLIFRRLLP
jgi:hypothetical protein